MKRDYTNLPEPVTREQMLERVVMNIFAILYNASHPGEDPSGKLYDPEDIPELVLRLSVYSEAQTMKLAECKSEIEQLKQKLAKAERVIDWDVQ